MKRRSFVKAALVAVPAAQALGAQQPEPRTTQAPIAGAAAPLPQAAAETPPLEVAFPDVAAEAVAPRFFTAQQFAALRQLGAILMPPYNGAPGAVEARAPEFLDFLTGQSLPDRQQLYRAGLDALNTVARKRFNKPFAELEPSDASTLLAPLREAWTPEPPADPLARFLRQAKQDIRTATVNSAEWNAAGQQAAGRRGGGFNQYWLPID